MKCETYFKRFRENQLKSDASANFCGGFCMGVSPVSSPSWKLGSKNVIVYLPVGIFLDKAIEIQYTGRLFQNFAFN